MVIKDPPANALSSATGVYQSLAKTSPPAGVQAFHQVCALMPEVRKRTLPSARATFMPLVWGEEATRRSHGPGLLSGLSGCTRNLEAVPVRKVTLSVPFPPANTAE